MAADPKLAEGASETPPLEAPRIAPRGDAGLAPAERRRRRRELWISGVAGLAIVAMVLGERELSALRALPASSGLLFLLLHALTVILFVLLVSLRPRNLVKLIFERRRGTLGSHLHLKFVMALFLVATIPTAVVFFVAYIFVTASLETWFSLRVDGAVERTREVADAYYDAWTAKALHFGERLAEGIRDGGMLREGHSAELEALVQAKQREYDLGVVQVFPYAEAEALVTSVNPEIPDAAFVQRDHPIAAAGLGGR